MAREKNLEAALADLKLQDSFAFFATPAATDRSLVLAERKAVTPKVEKQLKLSEQDRRLLALATLIGNVDPVEVERQGLNEWRFDKQKVTEVISQIDSIIENQLNEILHAADFQDLESSWRGLNDLVKNTPAGADVIIEMIDVTKAELAEDFEANASDVFGSDLFQKVYVTEYDQFGGRPYGALIGLYDFENTGEDIDWLRTMGKIANASHAPFIGAVSSRFFMTRQDIEAIKSREEEREALDDAMNLAIYSPRPDRQQEYARTLSEIKDLEGLMSHPRYGAWDAFRKEDWAAYVGLTCPRYMLRLPYDTDMRPIKGLNFREKVAGADNGGYLWGNSSILFARNMINSFATSGWCQYLRGPRGGGLITGLPVHTFEQSGEEVMKVPVEIVIPDYRELEFAKSGFIPLVYRKHSAEAAFFSCQSAKAVETFSDPKDSENSQLISNLSYTLSVTRIAHYVKSIMRDNIGTSADAPYIQNALNSWISRYVTAVTNPDDFTLRYFPFKAATVEVTEKSGELGRYRAVINVKPHIQFEGLEVELRLESRL
ncbi:MAG: type VI secretion system contractile sheath large subunit [Myxococcota bacterium]